MDATLRFSSGNANSAGDALLRDAQTWDESTLIRSAERLADVLHGAPALAADHGPNILAIRLLPMRCPRRKIGLPEQFSLFADKMSGPEGLRYAEEFVSPAVEKILIGHIAALPLQPFQFGQYEGKRRVASFGFRYDYTTRRLEEADPIPEWLGSIIETVEAFGGPGARMGQVLCTEYDVGVGIGWHRDKPHFDRVLDLSLGSACKFRFRRPAYTKWQRFTLEARPRSIYMMSGPSREVWEHSIPAVEEQRYSITFRTIAAKA
jgi:alkylated DNA repair dioxygenase AlkB